ncbi:MAG: hypothetical protein GY808_12015, partial [Gammaproteobacteria bacterium]|nr:hypothetical protein [Gammaproteobacteria bacterium]
TNGDTESALSPPSGWTEIRKGQSHGAVTFGVWWKIASSGDPIAFQFDWTGDDPFRSYGWIMRFTGHDSSSPIATSNKLTGSSDKPPSGNLTTDADGMLILRLGGFDDDDITLGSPGLSGHTVITMNRSNEGKGSVSGGAGYIIQATAGDTGTSSFSLKRSEEYCTVTVAIRPEP